MTADTHHPAYWKEHLVTGLGGHMDTEKGRFLDAQSQAEWSPGSGLPAAKWNPLNSTFYVLGATAFNTFQVGGVDVHVWNYPGPIAGVAATMLTLAQHDSHGLYYPTLLGHLQSAAGVYTAEQIAADCRADISKWGTSVDLILRILGRT